jgi:cytochrome c oxidase subunit II
LAALALHRNPPSNLERIDPATLHLSGEFTEPNLGTRIEQNGQVTTRIVATQFAFVPPCVVVPADREVTLRLASPDVIHGILVSGTNVNTMVVPGFVSQVHTVFRRTGDLLMPCHEFCGFGHSQILARVRVVPADHHARRQQPPIRRSRAMSGSRSLHCISSSTISTVARASAR